MEKVIKHYLIENNVSLPTKSKIIKMSLNKITEKEKKKKQKLKKKIIRSGVTSENRIKEHNKESIINNINIII